VVLVLWWGAAGAPPTKTNNNTTIHPLVFELSLFTNVSSLVQEYSYLLTEHNTINQNELSI